MGDAVSHFSIVENYYTPLDVILSLNDPVWKAWRTMKECQVQTLPVYDQQRIVGIVTSRDILQLSGQNGGQSMPVKDAMSLDPLLIPLTSSVVDAVNLMVQKDQYYALVVNARGEIRGTFSWRDASLHFLQESKKVVGS